MILHVYGLFIKPSNITGYWMVCHIPYFRDQMLPSISSRPRIIAAPPEVLNEIVAALD